MTNKTGLVYDEQMCLHKEEKHLECPDRIKSIYTAITNANLLKYCDLIPARPITNDELLLTHTENHVTTIQNIPNHNKDELEYLAEKYNSIYFNEHTFTSASIAAGSLIDLTSKVISNEIKNGIAIIRPPGHHAHTSKPKGFCIFNNVGITANVMLKKHNLSRIAILDLDVHHGDGTQEIFYSNDNVLYISIHRYDNGDFYPGESGNPKNVGCDAGLGKNINIGLNTNNYEKIGNSDYLYLSIKLIEPILKEYNPELILISAGFDCVIDDPLGDLNLTPVFFNYLIQRLEVLQSKIVVALEGGYNLNSISESMVHCCCALTGSNRVSFRNVDANQLLVSSVTKNAFLKTMKIHEEYWNCLKENN